MVCCREKKMINNDILITGGSGLLGTAFRSVYPHADYPTSAELDLMSRESIEQWFRQNNPSSVVHLAGLVGGVSANMNYMYDFYYKNSMINNNIIDACVENSIPKLVCCLSTCVYPDSSSVEYPLTENQLHKGEPHDSNFGYAYAKRMVDVQLKASREQHGTSYISVIPNNMYGENDNFDIDNSHVIPALIRKIYEAKMERSPSFKVWGTGDVFREFTYSKDVARAILFCLEKYDDADPINIGCTTEYHLKDIVSLICKILEYDGIIVYDHSKPTGQYRKPSSNKRLVDIGWKEEWYTPIEVGLRDTCQWFKENYHNARGIK